MDCTCLDWKSIVKIKELINKHPSYGWMLKWIVLTEEEGYTQIHRFCYNINYCPFCGGKLYMEVQNA